MKHILKQDLKTFGLTLYFIISIFILFSGENHAQNTSNKWSAFYDSISFTKTKITGYPGQKIDRCIEKRIIGQDIDHLVAPFHQKNETWCWQSEFWGKWMLSAVAAYQYTKDKELYDKMDYGVRGLMKTQLPSGYIGNYGPDLQLSGWDIWGRKYSMLGLIRFYEISGDKEVLQTAQRVADHLIGQLGPGKINIIQTGFYRGMASTSVLEPIVYLYNYTKNQRYLDFANYIITQWESETGPKLISKGMEGDPVKNRFPPPEKWWSWENGQKAYEMMSCYEGLLELYKVTGVKKYLQAVIRTVDHIIEAEINIAGSGSAFECWYGGVEHQTRPTYHTMETCVTITWMKLCHNLWELTQDSRYADQLERSFFNALLASMKYDASQILKYSPLEGVRHEGEEQCGMHINCCNANGPRGFTLIPRFAVINRPEGIYFNYYGSSESSTMLPSGHRLDIIQHTNYPVGNLVTFEIKLERPENLTLHFRIPVWSENTGMEINGEKVEGHTAGKYTTLSRTWSSGDQVSLEFDMPCKLITLNGYQAILRGPIVLARDSRFKDGYVDEAAIIQHNHGKVELKLVKEKPDHIWMAFVAPLALGTVLEDESSEPQFISFCDFASAGNTWKHTDRYRVWIPQPLNVMSSDYEK